MAGEGRTGPAAGPRTERAVPPTERVEPRTGRVGPRIVRAAPLTGRAACLTGTGGRPWLAGCLRPRQTGPSTTCRRHPKL
ncbi:hypothetical protein E2C01_081022 [Portunus trituberculatus]|uniref:Uncharacterized protein n=1 Tax=Portunus trituberculatus TaxID=210409 RepID=A0A5B7J155_PORTR|nr:hypothetical protein [Portunus trituberculatus]